MLRSGAGLWLQQAPAAQGENPLDALWGEKIAGGQLVHAQTGGVVPENGPVAGQGLLLPPGALSPRPAVLRPPGDIQITAVQIALQGLQQLGGQIGRASCRERV